MRQSEGVRESVMDIYFLADVVLCAIFVVFETIEIQKGEKVVEKQLGTPRDHMDWSKVLVYTIQVMPDGVPDFLINFSLSLPLSLSLSLLSLSVAHSSPAGIPQRSSLWLDQ